MKILILLFVLNTAIAKNLWKDDPTYNKAGLVNVVVEIPAGTNDKWEVSKPEGKLFWDQKNGKNRVVNFLPYLGNYGMIPQTILPKKMGGDGDPLDILVLGQTVKRGSLVAARVIGLMSMKDGGEIDDKVLAVDPKGPLGHIKSVGDLKKHHPNVVKIISIWFGSYKGPRKMKVSGVQDKAAADKMIKMSHNEYLNLAK